jgi:hypothetical protein
MKAKYRLYITTAYKEIFLGAFPSRKSIAEYVQKFNISNYSIEEIK